MNYELLNCIVYLYVNVRCRTRHHKAHLTRLAMSPKIGAGVHTLLFDLDGTLYPIENGYEKAVRDRVFEFMVDELKVESIESAKEQWWTHFKAYNQTLRALRQGMGFDFDREKYWSHIRGDPADFLEANFDALEMLRAFPGMKKIVLTNCAEKQAIEALQVLGLEGEFDAVYGADFMGDVCKPERAAFEAVCARAKIDPHGTAFFEDSLKNLVTAKEMGFTTVLVSGKTAAEESGQNGGFTPGRHDQRGEPQGATRGAPRSVHRRLRGVFGLISNSVFNKFQLPQRRPRFRSHPSLDREGVDDGVGEVLALGLAEPREGDAPVPGHVDGVLLRHVLHLRRREPRERKHANLPGHESSNPCSGRARTGYRTAWRGPS